MKVVGCELCNFLGVSEEPVFVPLADFSVLVGRNDVGKSTVLNALNTFLNDELPSHDVLNRLAERKQAYITLVCLLPEILISAYAVPFYLGGTSILIVISVTLDTVAQIQSHLVAHQYEGLIKRSKLRGSGGGIVKK